MPTSVAWNSSQSGQRRLVAAFIKQPAVVRQRMIRMLDQQFLTDAILRQGPRADGGAVQYNESTGLYASEDVSTVAEFGEIPTTTGNLGVPKVVYTVKKALGLEISIEMRDRDDVGAVDIQFTQIRNTMRRAWERVFVNALLSNASVHTIGATAAWSSGSSKIRYDLAQAGLLVEESDADTTDNTGDNKFEFEPDTLLISRKTKADFLSSDDVAKVFTNSPLASQNLQYTGKLPRQFFGLDVIASRQLPSNMAVVLQRKIVGGVSDERPLTVKPLREQPDNETWRMDVVRRSAVFIDQPKAACIITGV